MPKVGSLHRGVYYFAAYKTARAWAQDNGWPTRRIIAHGRGWAVQSREGGHYAGPGETP
jgi:hypothetical protein